LNSYNSSLPYPSKERNGENRHFDSDILSGAHQGQHDLPAPPNLIGAELSATDFAALESRWMDRPLAESAFLRRVDSWTGAQLVGRKGGDYAGIAIPYFAPGDHHVREYRLRRDHPDLEADLSGQLKVKQKYLSPPGRSNMLYLPPNCDAALLGNAELPLIITEGEWDLAHGKGVDDHLAAVGPEAVLDEIARVRFSAFNWREELIRAKPTPAHPQGNIYPILANAINALRHSPEWQGVLAFNEFLLTPMAIKPTPWGAISNAAWSDHEDRLTAEWLQRKGILVDVGTAAPAAQTVSKDRSFHPVRQYGIDCLGWHQPIGYLANDVFRCGGFELCQSCWRALADLGHSKNLPTRRKGLLLFKSGRRPRQQEIHRAENAGRALFC
jgi:hypothetical protein